MSGTYTSTVGDRGRFVLPAPIRERLGLEPGSTLILVDGPDGVVLFTRDQLRRRIGEDLADHDLVGELLADRALAAEAEDRG